VNKINFFSTHILGSSESRPFPPFVLSRGMGSLGPLYFLLIVNYCHYPGDKYYVLSNLRFVSPNELFGASCDSFTSMEQDL